MRKATAPSDLFADTADGRRRRRFLVLVEEHSRAGGRGLAHRKATGHFVDVNSLVTELIRDGYLVAHDYRGATGLPGAVYRLPSDGRPPGQVETAGYERWRARRSAGLTQRELGERAGVTRRTVRGAERDRLKPGPSLAAVDLALSELPA